MIDDGPLFARLRTVTVRCVDPKTTLEWSYSMREHEAEAFVARILAGTMVGPDGKPWPPVEVRYG